MDTRHLRHSRLVVVGALAALVAGGCGGQEPAAVETQPVAGAPAPGTIGDGATLAATPAPIIAHVRALHAVPDTGRLTLRASDQEFASLEYQTASAFFGLDSASTQVSAFGADNARVAGPMPLTVAQGDDVTVLVTGVPGDVVLLPWRHRGHEAVADRAKLAFVHSAKALPALDIIINGESFRRGVEFGIATDYTTLNPGQHVVQVSYDRNAAPLVVESRPPTVVRQDAQGNTLSVEQAEPVRTVVPRSERVTLNQSFIVEAGKVYSLAIFHDGAQEPRIVAIEDQMRIR